MRAKRTRKAKAGKMAKKHKSKQVSKKTYARIRLLAAAALAFCAVMAIVVDASDQSKATPIAFASTSSSSSSSVAPITQKPAAAAAKPTPDSTYVGCLREDNGKFVMTEIGGPDAPKSRNWKTMFVTKKAGKFEIAPVGSLRLSPYVNQTVQVTGKRNDKMFAARSLKVVGSTCN
jgi:hypothetical protein